MSHVAKLKITLRVCELREKAERFYSIRALIFILLKNASIPHLNVFAFVILILTQISKKKKKSDLKV